MQMLLSTMLNSYILMTFICNIF